MRLNPNIILARLYAQHEYTQGRLAIQKYKEIENKYESAVDYLMQLRSRDRIDKSLSVNKSADRSNSRQGRLPGI
jgi:hypothetical protein